MLVDCRRAANIGTVTKKQSCTGYRFCRRIPDNPVMKKQYLDIWTLMKGYQRTKIFDTFLIFKINKVPMVTIFLIIIYQKKAFSIQKHMWKNFPITYGYNKYPNPAGHRQNQTLDSRTFNRPDSRYPILCNVRLYNIVLPDIRYNPTINFPDYLTVRRNITSQIVQFQTSSRGFQNQKLT